jgi:succinoglycan biosynthesis protein ExoM
MESAKEARDSNMSGSDSDLPHITVCICTYQRPRLLGRLLQELQKQETDKLFFFSISVVDNDRLQSAKDVVAAFKASSTIPICYTVVPEQNISLARNRAIDEARGNLLAFIDDDEFPVSRWLLLLFQAMEKYSVSGVLGPVKRHFEETPPKWVIRSRFYDRETYPTGTSVSRREARSGNVLLKRSILVGESCVFRPEFRGGEDTDFFGRMMDKGYRFIWCDEAIAYEVVPPVRWNRKFLLKRAILRGANTTKYANFGLGEVAKSLIAVPLYAVALPFAFIRGQHLFMDLLVRLCDHLGKLLAVVGINPIKEYYVLE